jgi:hypothetical protein
MDVDVISLISKRRGTITTEVDDILCCQVPKRRGMVQEEVTDFENDQGRVTRIPRLHEGHLARAGNEPLIINGEFLGACDDYQVIIDDEIIPSHMEFMQAYAAQYHFNTQSCKISQGFTVVRVRVSDDIYVFKYIHTDGDFDHELHTFQWRHGRWDDVVLIEGWSHRYEMRTVYQHNIYTAEVVAGMQHAEVNPREIATTFEEYRRHSRAYQFS